VAPLRHTCGAVCNSCGDINDLISHLQSDPVALLFWEMQHLSDAMRNGTLLAEHYNKRKQ
jgi:hypothetical protein